MVSAFSEWQRSIDNVAPVCFSKTFQNISKFIHRESEGLSIVIPTAKDGGSADNARSNYLPGPSLSFRTSFRNPELNNWILACARMTKAETTHKPVCHSGPRSGICRARMHKCRAWGMEPPFVRDQKQLNRFRHTPE